MANCNAPKDIIAEHVRQLLDLDEGGQRAQLASLSAYAATKNTQKTHSINGGTSRSKSDRVRPGVASSASVSTYGGSNGGSNGGSGREPSYSAESTESSGSEGPRGQVTDSIGAPGLSLQKDEPAFAPSSSMATHNEASASQQLQELQHSTDLLKAALANWEACLQTEEALAAEQALPAKIPVQSLKSATPTPTSASSLAANQLLAQVGQQEWPGTVQEDATWSAARLLRQHLEKQQEESVLKILKMMQDSNKKQVQQKPGLDAMANCSTAAASQAQGSSAVWPSMVMGMHNSFALAGAYPGQPMCPPVPMPGAFGMHPMLMQPGMPWASQMGVPSAPVMGNTQMRRPLNAQTGRHQGQDQRNGSHAALPGQNGNAPRKNRGAAPAGIEEETLRTHLRELQKVDPDNVVLVRKINRLGFESPTALKAHYSKYGKVDRVLVAHSHVKSQNRRFAARLRPSGLGFVVMSNKAGADAILAQGQEQVVAGGPDNAGATIRVQRFQRCTEDTKQLNLLDEDEEGNAAEVLAREESNP